MRLAIEEPSASVQRLRQHLAQQGLGVTEATDSWDLAGGLLSRILRGERPLSRNLIVRIGGQLSLSPGDLLDWLADEQQDWLWRNGYRAPSVLPPSHPGKCVMTHDQIEEARYLHEQQELSYAKIGRLFHVSAATVMRALSVRRDLERPTIPCEWCGKVFLGIKGQRFCSPKHERAATGKRWRENHREQYNESKRAWWHRRKARMKAEP